MDNLKNKVQAAMDKIAQGSLGFFQNLIDKNTVKYMTGWGGVIITDYGSEEEIAVEILKDCVNEGTVVLGDENDATSLENMKFAIEQILKMNEARS